MRVGRNDPNAQFQGLTKSNSLFSTLIKLETKNKVRSQLRISVSNYQSVRNILGMEGRRGTDFDPSGNGVQVETCWVYMQTFSVRSD